MKKLGEVQRHVLKNLLNENRSWYPYPGEWSGRCGWIWNTYSGTIKILEGLVKRGLVEETTDPKVSGRVFRVKKKEAQEALNAD